MSQHLPIGVYTIPEISFVGKTEEQLTQERVPYEIGISRWRELARGQIVGDSNGLLKLLSIDSLPEQTRDLILAKAEGNPFFVEEVIRMLIDRNAISRDGDRWVANEKAATVEIPDTLHGLLLARIDRLPAESRRTLRVASVIGRQFGITILEKLLEPKAP